MRNKDMPWFDDQCWHAFGLQQEAHIWWISDCSRVNWEEFVRFEVRLMKPTQGTSISLVSETGMFL